MEILHNQEKKVSTIPEMAIVDFLDIDCLNTMIHLSQREESRSCRTLKVSKKLRRTDLKDICGQLGMLFSALLLT